MTKPTNSELAQVARAALDYIDALPGDVVAKLPVMPVFDRDWADNAIADAQRVQRKHDEAISELAAVRQQLAAVTAENVVIKTMNDCLSEELRSYESDGAFEGPKMHLLWWQAETPATDAALAEIMAQGVDMFASYCSSANNGHEINSTVEEILAFARYLRGEDSK
ncbi:hypothetical protein RJ498_000845 [Pluralibacter gergoviae]